MRRLTEAFDERDILKAGRNIVAAIWDAQVKFIYSEKATKILQNLPLTFDYSTYGQKLGEDFAKFCGLLKIYELYVFVILWDIFFNRFAKGLNQVKLLLPWGIDHENYKYVYVIEIS